jgi:diguanylate cyclase (GGDEF)-like protein
MIQQTIIERFREIEQLAEKFHLLETRILGVLNFRDFFEVLYEQIGDIFEVPHVWFSLICDEQAAAPIHRAALSARLRERLNLIERGPFEQLFGTRDKPLLENENLTPYQALLPERDKFHFKSLAMVPVSLNGRLVGSLNLADGSAKRFHPGYNPVHLERLSVKVSLFLSNVTAHENLQYLAFHDPLTDLHNRRAMEQALEREFARAQRYCSHLSLAFIDLDLFKLVNDTYGHDCGDALLKYLADGLVQMSRQSDMVTRLAGDEFVLLLPETVLSQAQILLQRMADRFFEQPMEWQGEKIPIHISFGIASVMEDNVAAAEDLLKLADDRLYQKKRARQSRG